MAFGMRVLVISCSLFSNLLGLHALPLPTPEQASYMDMGFTQFMHFSVTTFGNIEHDCVNGKCLPASMFNPTNISTDQWVETAVKMGAGEICLTAHHEGGFCLWPSSFSNYTVMQSQYKHDILKPFVKSCAKYGIRPCFYIGPNANGYFTQVLKYNASQFIAAQKGMIREVLTEYGFIHRLWWDHYQLGCGGLSECPGGFPQAWDSFTALVRSISPGTLMGTGPDVGHSGGSESGVGDYPVWNTCNTTSGNPEQLCSSWGPGGAIFRPREADATIQNPGDAWFWKRRHAFWNATQLWTHYLSTVGRGENFILNLPPDETGQIPAQYVQAATQFGDALRATFTSPIAAVLNVTTPCHTPVVLQLPAGTLPGGDAGFLIETREGMATAGQRIAAYGVDSQAGDDGAWTPLPPPSVVHGQTVGNRIIDSVPAGALPQGTTALRFRCLAAVAEPIRITRFAIYRAAPPPSRPAAMATAGGA